MAFLLAASPALAQDEYDSGMGELSLNAGFALPLGSAVKGVNESDAINFSVPFGIQVGYRIAGVVFVGGTFTYGPFGSPTSTSVPACAMSGSSCHSTTFHTGFTVQWHPWGSRGIDPYLGIGAGYEFLYVDASLGAQTANAQYNGWTWLDVPLGVDFRLSKDVRLGPYFDFLMGEYRNATATINGSTVSGLIPHRTLHFWLSAGVRVVFLGL